MIDKSKFIPYIKEGLLKSGILQEKDKICTQDINDIRYGYPIYDKDYHAARSDILEFLKTKQIFPCGRYGSWRYMSMEDSILDGLAIAKYFK